MSTILEYWKSHPEYWIALGPRQAEADKEITERFWGTNKVLLDDWLSCVIYYDQFMRHFSRVSYTNVKEVDVMWSRQLAATYVNWHIDELVSLDEPSCYFCLMALKHEGNYETIFDVVQKWVPNGKSLTDYPILSRFYMDTYKKAYTQEVVHAGYVNYLGKSIYDSAEICEYYPSPVVEPVLPTCAESMISSLRAIKYETPLVLSLSGGVDSMVMCALLKHAGIKFYAVHMIYGNRSTSIQEAMFIQDYCKGLGIRVYFYKIKWIRRGWVEREFYESMTRSIRFMMYRNVGDGAPVLLGHIREDAIENVWTNFAKCAHLDDPAVLKPTVVEDGVTICRPWINVKKEDIYAVARAMGVPYLKNTTPSWSNRGKFRTAFYEATHAQYGPSVDDKILETAAALKKQATLVQKLLYAPMLDSWDGETRCCMITRGVDAELDGAGWSTFFTALCHTKLGISKPSIHACAEFSARVQRPFDTQIKITLKKDFTVIVEKCDDDYLLVVQD